ncbi:expansin A13 [Wolffia australiana]
MPAPNPTQRRRPHLLLSLHFILAATAASHQTSSTFPDDALSEWKPARATFYSTDDPRDSIAGACGYGDLSRVGYGLGTAGLSETLFEKGRLCGACFEIRCVEELRYCIPGTSIKLTATNFCPSNYGLQDGPCNPPNRHLVMPIEAFEKIAIWKAGNMPVQYRRVKCSREGGLRFTVDGYGVFLTVLISNVGGAGDVAAVKVKGAKTGWLQMARNWGQNWQINAELRGQPLSFEVTTGDGATVTSYNVAPAGWTFGQTFVGKQFGS